MSNLVSACTPKTAQCKSLKHHCMRQVMAMAVSLDSSVALSVSADHLVGRYDIDIDVRSYLLDPRHARAPLTKNYAMYSQIRSTPQGQCTGRSTQGTVRSQYTTKGVYAPLVVGTAGKSDNSFLASSFFQFFSITKTIRLIASHRIASLIHPHHSSQKNKIK